LKVLKISLTPSFVRRERGKGAAEKLLHSLFTKEGQTILSLS
jgi:hypothetical protein